METKILVIEDNPEMLENISGILELANYEVITASNGVAGVGVAQTHRPDLIICDIMMPSLDGFGVLHLLSKDKNTADIPFIFLTAKMDKTDYRKGMNLGADDYITKPFDGLELLNAVELRLRKHKSLTFDFKSSSESIDLLFNEARKIRDFKKLTDRRSLRKYKKRDIIYLEEQIPIEMYFIQSGKIKTFQSTQEGKEFILGFHGPGDCIGFIPLITAEKSVESAIAMEDSEVYIIPKQEFLTMLYTNKEVAKRFIALLANNLQEAEKRLLELAYLSVRQKVASALLKVYHAFDKAKLDEPMISISRRDLSNLIGTATESLNRTLADFKDEGLIDLKEDGILIIDRASIEDIVK